MLLNRCTQWGNLMIDIGKFEKRINLLKSGKTLMLKHLAFGDYLLQMNPQRNRIFCKRVLRGEENISEDRLNYLLMWDCGDWYLYEEPVNTACTCCNGTGVIRENAEHMRV